MTKKIVFDPVSEKYVEVEVRGPTHLGPYERSDFDTDRGHFIPGVGFMCRAHITAYYGRCPYCKKDLNET
jgi:hypothetical protein